MSAEQLSAIAGVVLSLAFSYMPGLSDAFAKLTAPQKQATMGLLLIVVAASFAGLSCAGAISGVTCDQPGLTVVVNAVIAALVANQATYLISPKPATPATKTNWGDSA